MELEPTIEAELDLPPEYCHYHDEGCELAESCLNCPFPECIYDEPGGKQRLLKEQRNAEIVKLFSTGKKSVKELAQMFNLSVRTIQRALKKQRQKL